MTDPMPNLDFVRRACSQCGARTEKQAETKCTATQGMDGDYHCAGEFNEDGWSVAPTAKSLKRLDDWYGRDAAKRGWI